MEIEDFLKQFIDGYLLADLAAMSAVTPPPGQTGACGYSMVLVTLAGCELLGALTCSRSFNPFEGSEHFAYFWRNGLYPTDSVRAALAPTAYKVVRHGLAHAFVTKPMILVTKNKGTKNHLCRDTSGVLTIDCLALADDFRSAYERLVIPKLQTISERAALQQQLDLMHTQQSKESDAQAILIGSAPVGDPTEGLQFIPSGQVMAKPTVPIPSGVARINSPAPLIRWSRKP